jgi:hypothetical protein
MKGKLFCNKVNGFYQPGEHFPVLFRHFNVARNLHSALHPEMKMGMSISKRLQFQETTQTVFSFSCLPIVLQR